MVQEVASQSDKRSRRDEAGQTLVEYALILVLFSIVMVGALNLFADGLGGLYSMITDAIPN